MVGKTHELKIWPEFYDAVLSGVKPFEVRRNDRDFRVADNLRLREWNPETREYTGRAFSVLVTYVSDLSRIGIEGFLVMGIRL